MIYLLLSIIRNVVRLKVFLGAVTNSEERRTVHCSVSFYFYFVVATLNF